MQRRFSIYSMHQSKEKKPGKMVVCRVICLVVVYIMCWVLRWAVLLERYIMFLWYRPMTVSNVDRSSQIIKLKWKF